MTTTDPAEDLLGATEAAAILGVSAKSMHRYADDGRLPVTRTPGGHRRFRRRDLEALRDSLTTPGRPESSS